LHRFVLRRLLGERKTETGQQGRHRNAGVKRTAHGILLLHEVAMTTPGT
jgi:hypothetical protein